MGQHPDLLFEDHVVQVAVCIVTQEGRLPAVLADSLKRQGLQVHGCIRPVGRAPKGFIQGAWHFAPQNPNACMPSGHQLVVGSSSTQHDDLLYAATMHGAVMLQILSRGEGSGV